MSFLDIVEEQGGKVENNLIKILPKCAVNNCEENGIVYCLGKFVCGHHLIEISKKHLEKEQEIFNNIDGGEIKDDNS